jgi:hypothetical protein
LNQTNHFFDLGYGWLCKHCSAADTEANHQPQTARGSVFNNAEPEKQAAKPPGLALATWTDPSRQGLVCPRCGIRETISNA